MTNKTTPHFKGGVLVSPKLLAMFDASPVRTKKPVAYRPFKERLIAVLEKHLANG